MPQGMKQSYSYTESPRFTKYSCHFTAKVGETTYSIFEITCISRSGGGGREPQRLFQDLLSCESGTSLTAPLLVKAAMMKLMAYYVEHANGRCGWR